MAAEGRRISLDHLSYVTTGAVVGGLVGKAASCFKPALKKGGIFFGSLLGILVAMLLTCPKMMSNLNNLRARQAATFLGKTE